MRRALLISGIVLSAALFTTSQALASTCPKLIQQIEDETGNRLDDASYAAKMKAAEAAQLHKDGKHAESEKVAREGLALLGLTAK